MFRFDFRCAAHAGTYRRKCPSDQLSLVPVEVPAQSRTGILRPLFPTFRSLEAPLLHCDSGGLQRAVRSCFACLQIIANFLFFHCFEENWDRYPAVIVSELVPLTELQRSSLQSIHVSSPATQR